MVCVEFVSNFYFDMCKLLRADALVEIFREFEPNVHYSVDSLRIVNSHYINYSGDILRKKQDMSFKFVLPQLIHTVKWKFDYILFRKARKEWTVILWLNVKPCLDMLIYQEKLNKAWLAMISGLQN